MGPSWQPEQATHGQPALPGGSMLTYHLLPLSPSLMRFYRTRILIDLPTLLEFLPLDGRLLDVGCGTGLLDYAIARRRPHLKILGIDIDERAVELASRYN